jgi:hypothetical protein
MRIGERNSCKAILVRRQKTWWDEFLANNRTILLGINEVAFVQNKQNIFKLHSEYSPTGDQPQAIEKLVKGFREGNQCQTLLGVQAPARPLPWQM